MPRGRIRIGSSGKFLVQPPASCLLVCPLDHRQPFPVGAAVSVRLITRVNRQIRVDRDIVAKKRCGLSPGILFRFQGLSPENVGPMTSRVKGCLRNQVFQPSKAPSPPAPS